MRIDAIWIEGYRSIRSLRLENLGQFNVFYGPNGSGKSNILQAVATLGRVLVPAVSQTVEQPSDVKLGTSPSGAELLRDADFSLQDPRQQIVLGVRLQDVPSPILPGSKPSVRRVSMEVEVGISRQAPGYVRLTLRRLMVRWGDKHGEGTDLLVLWGDLREASPIFRALRQLLQVYSLPGERESYGSVEEIHRSREENASMFGQWRSHVVHWLERAVVDGYFRVVPPVRYLSTESVASSVSLPASPSAPSELLKSGRLKEALFYALTSPNPSTRRGLDRLRNLLSGEPLFRPPFDPVFDPEARRYDLQERVPIQDSDELAPSSLTLDLAGLGVQQVYFVLAEILLGGASAVAVEEPEAHLHAPTTGRALRTLLRRVVEERYIQQIFIATHSNLFDLDPTGYFDVRFDPERGTVVERRDDLSRIDRDHLWEPGPAKHALMDMLGYLPGDTVVFRRPDGSSISAVEMLRLLQEDHDDAAAFLRDVHGAALRVVRVRAQRDPGRA